MSANTVIKKLPRPWSVGGQVVKEIELRPPTLGDLMDAEKEAVPGMQLHAFDAAVACQTMVRAGSYTGPFVIGQFRSMHPRNFVALREAIQEAERLGEDEPADQEPSS